MPKHSLIGTAYERVLLAARARGHILGKRAQQRLNSALREALKDLDTRSTNPMTRARALDLKKQITGMLAQFEKFATNETTGAVRVTVLDTVKLHQGVLEGLVKKFRPDAAETLLRFNSLNVRAMQALAAREKNAAVFKTLLRRNIVEAAPDLDRLLINAVGRGVSIRTVSKDVGKILNGDFPSLQEYGLKQTELSGARTVLSDARRIARSEVNNAMREANRLALSQSPVVSAAKWQTSGAHDKEDECDDLATADDFGFGPGFYPMESWPIAPHPNCGCYAGEIRFKPPEEWAA